ncbi:MAG: M20/M25/M40 family metallo-hydrolase [Candidatus Bathyarchaeia archaeon]
MREYAVDLLQKILRLYSPTGEEAELSHFLVEEMQKLGLRSWRDEAGNAIGEFGSGEPVILLCGHMDTVPGVLPIKLEDGKLYGRGAVDAKTPLTAMVVASSILFNEGFSGRVLVVGAVEEEGVGQGVKHLVEKGVTADYAIFGEPSGVENITIAYKGSLHLKITCETTTGHSSAPWLYKNAIEEVFKVYERIKGVSFTQEKTESRFYSVTYSVTKIEGGNEFSTVPSSANLHINTRVPPTLSIEIVLDEVYKVVEDYRDENGVDVRLSVIDSCPPYEADKNSLLVRSIAYAIRRVRKSQAVLVRRTGSGDMNLFGSTRNVPVVTYGAGDAHLDHTPNEYVVVDEYLDSIKILCEGVKKLRELHLKTMKNKGTK